MSRSPLCSSVLAAKQVVGFVALFCLWFFCQQTFKSQILVFHSLFVLIHQINQLGGLLCDLDRTPVLEISREDGEREISEDGSGNSSARPGSSSCGVGTAETPSHPTQDLVPRDMGCELCGDEEGVEACFIPPLLPQHFGWAGSPCQMAEGELWEHSSSRAQACLPYASVTALAPFQSELR